MYSIWGWLRSYKGTIFFTKALVHIGCSCMLGWGLGYNNLCPLHGPSYLLCSCHPNARLNRRKLFDGRGPNKKRNGKQQNKMSTTVALPTKRRG